jgi:integrase/recombinase XerD
LVSSAHANRLAPGGPGDSDMKRAMKNRNIVRRIATSIPCAVTSATANGHDSVTVPMGAGKEAPPTTRHPVLVLDPTNEKLSQNYEKRPHMPQSEGCGHVVGLLGLGMNTAQLVSPEGLPSGDTTLILAVSAFLARYKGQSRVHSDSDLRVYLGWCHQHDLDPLQARRPHIEVYLRWMQEVQHFQPSTVSRRLSVVTGFYRTCVIDGLLEHSPAEFVRRPHVSTDSPTLGLSHLQLEALLTASRDSANLNDFALVAMLSLLGLRIFEATGADIPDLSEVHGHRVLTVLGKGDRLAQIPLPPAVGRAIDRAIAERAEGPILRNRAGRRMSRHSATRRLHVLASTAGITIARVHPHMLRHTYVTTMLDAGVDLRDVQIAARHADPRTTMRYDRARKNLDRHPNYVLAAYMASGT